MQNLPQHPNDFNVYIDPNLDFPRDEIDEILDCGDDLAAMEQTAFMSSSKTMLSMIDSMI